MTIHPIPHTPFRIGYIPRSVFPTQDVIQWLYSYGKKNNILFIKIEPNELKEKLYTSQPERIIESLQKSRIRIVSSPHPLFPQWTQILNLTKSTEELLGLMKPKTRYNIRLAQKKGVVVREESNDKGYEIFEKLYFETCKRQKYFGHTRLYHRTHWKALKQSISHILIAYYKDIPLAAYQLFFFNNSMYYVYGGTSSQYRNLMAANLLMWESIRFAQKIGAKTFDMWGSLSPNYDMKNPWAGFTRFKEGYGTTFVQTIGSYDLVIRPFLFAIYTILNVLRQHYLSLKIMAIKQP